MNKKNPNYYNFLFDANSQLNLASSLTVEDLTVDGDLTLSATSSLRIITREIWLILPEATAFGVRLSHASRKKLDSLHTAQ